MAQIEFKSKGFSVYTPDGSFSHTEIPVPTLTRRHCDMAAFRKHKKYGGFANSDLFPGMLDGIRRTRLGSVIRAETPPKGVTVDCSGFLARITLDV